MFLSGTLRISIISLFVLTCNILNGQVRLNGKITDRADHEPIAGAILYFPELKKGTMTDTTGNYSINNLPKTRVVVEISFLGYKSIVETIDLSHSATFDFTMEQAVTEINEVVVTGTTRAVEITKSPIPIVTMSSIQLLQNSNTNIISSISRIAGISAVSTGPNISKPFIHGLGYNRVLTLFDGIRQEGQQWGNEHGIEIDQNLVDRIEIIKGPASLTYGPDALAGVINLIPAPPAPEGVVKAHFETSYQTNNRLINLHTAIDGNKNGLVWGGVITHKQATDYRNKYDGRVYNTGFNETDFSGYAGLNKKWGYSDLNFSVFNDLQEIPDGSRDSITRKFTRQITEADTFRPIVSERELNSYKIGVMHQLVQHYKIYSSNNFILGDNKLKVVLGYQENVRREFSHPQSPSIPGLYLNLKTITYDVKYYFPEKKGWETTIGLNGMYQLNKNKGTAFIIPDYHQYDIGSYLFESKTIGKVDFSGGIRYDMRVFNNSSMYTRNDPVTGFETKVTLPDTVNANHQFYNFSNNFSGISASSGIIFNITKKLNLKANIARGFRAPNISEISANGVHPGTLIYQIGNTSFKPEFSLQEDLGLNFRSDRISFDLDLYNNNISNYIFNQRLLDREGRDSIIVEGNQTFKFQQSKAHLYGVDAFLDIHPFSWLSFENSISYVSGLNKSANGIKVNDSSKYLPLIPPFHTNTELRGNLKLRFSNFRIHYVSTAMEYYAKQTHVYSAYATETPSKGYILFNAGFGGDIADSNGKIIVTVNILGSNLLNNAYQSNLSRLKYIEQYPDNPSGRSGIYEMGRNISFKLTFPI
jgi:iron complex outermembrane receptor protein